MIYLPFQLEQFQQVVCFQSLNFVCFFILNYELKGLFMKSTMAFFPFQKLYSILCSCQKRCLYSKCRNHTRNIKISCLVVLCALIPFNILFYTRGCRHTTSIFNPERSDSFLHGHPPQIPQHLVLQEKQITDATSRAIDLLSAKVAPILHFVWCDSDYFEYKHYLSLISAYKHLQPSSIYFHYAYLKPEMDSDGYYQFFHDIQRDLPNLGKNLIVKIEKVKDYLPQQIFCHI